MIILAIETSCDETAISIIEASQSSVKNEGAIYILANEILSQIQIHKKYGGVFPMMAKREHGKNLIPIFEKALEHAHMLKKNIASQIYSGVLENIRMDLEREPELFEKFAKFIETAEKPKIDKIVVTVGPGLEPTLWVGVNFAFALSHLWDIPLYGVNHMAGHVAAGLASFTDENKIKIQNIKYPALALLISGGHTELVLLKNINDYKIIGQTKDDAVGEAYDKVARLLGLEYPGGPQISKLAEISRSNNAKINYKPKWKLPRPMINSGNLDFSFSGLKTAVFYTVRKIADLTDEIKTELAREFEDAVAEVLVSKTKNAMNLWGAKTLIIGGGVSANTHIRREFMAFQKERADFELRISPLNLSTDNALMIALAGLIDISLGKKPMTKPVVNGNLKIDA